MAVLLSFFEKRKGPSPPPAPPSPQSAMIKLKPSRCTNIHFDVYELIRVHVRKLPFFRGGGGGGGGGGGVQINRGYETLEIIWYIP